ncbi:DUF167 family protein [Victivallis sp. Marseille-Q1083]|uniref:DUF167 domain-containing protein n=1 Tax=Victivallis sp. Marseille-Q1083 TaxID=2717288 RepID=UPI00158BE26A|nr:DUF167 family protein [Victivallis sp. Marseille-Q1083]
MADWRTVLRPDGAGGCVVKCHVQPRSSRSRPVGLYEESLKVALTAPPVDGKANAELIACLAKFFGLPKGRVSLWKGAAARDKLVVLAGLAPEEAGRRLEEKLN